MADVADKKLLTSVGQRIGSVVAGKYTLKKVLGVGGMGAVYEAVHSFTDRTVAVKLLHGDFSRMTEVGKRFLHEAKATTSLEHPCILEVLDAGQDTDGRLYLVFEYLRGRTLTQALASKPPSLEDVVRVFVHVLDALAIAHAQGIVHRDIKPGNIFLCDDKPFPERVKLIDFGIARRSSQRVGDGLTAAGTILGTPSFMSPELLLGEPVDPAADLWAMSVSMYAGLTNKKPFRGRDPNAIVADMMQSNLQRVDVRRPEVPSEIASIIHRGLIVERKQRWPSAAAMADALRAAAPYLEAPAARPSQQVDLPEIQPAATAASAEEEWVATEAVEVKPDWRVALDEIKGEIGDLGPAASPLPTTAASGVPSLWKRATSWLGRRRSGDDDT